MTKMARVLVEYSLGIRPGQRLLIEGRALAQPLMYEVYRRALQAGGLPELRVTLEGFEELFYREATEAQLDAPPSPLLMTSVRDYQAILTILGNYNTRSLSAIDPVRIARRSRGHAEYAHMRMSRIGTGELHWCGTQYPAAADAQEASMSLSDYEEFVFAACLVMEDDPVAAWRRVHEEQAAMVERLEAVSAFRIKAPGTDLRFGAAGRKWINCDGRLNFPDGEIFTGPLENSVEGEISFSFPGIYAGQEIEGIWLKFAAGQVVEAKAAKGEALLYALLDTDEGARRVGEIAVGTNFAIQKFTRNMLFDEKIGGTVHLALGHGIVESGSKNESAIHWDMLCDMRQGGEMYADGALIYKDGRFV
ncbi:MAG: aminopeptidase [Bacteroidota bacterium]